MTQTALIYARISTEEQSNWSLDGQQKTARDYCERKGIHVIAAFADEVSGKTFDRPGWIEMMSAIKKHRPTFVICAKYDRISRNAAESLGLIEKTEDKYNVRFLSAMEEVPISPHSPFFFKMRADMLVNAHFELLVIRDRTSQGLYNAAKQGRFIGTAPFGYDNKRDESKRPIIVINEEQAAVVKNMFQWYLDGMTFAEIQAKAEPMGFTRKGKEAVQRILRSPIFAGKVLIPAYSGSEPMIGPGSHPPIVSEEVFWQVQDKMSGGTTNRRFASDEVPMRGLLMCEQCGKPLTSSRSKGNGGGYSYYFCHRHTSRSHRVEMVDSDMTEVLSGLSFGPDLIEVLKTLAERELKRLISSKTETIKMLERDLKLITDRIESLEMKLLDNVVNHDTYKKLKPSLEADRAEVESRLSAARIDETDTWQAFSDNLHMLGRIDKVYQVLPAENKRKMLRLLFGENLQRTENGFRTNYVMPVFDSMALNINKLQYKKETGTPAETASIPVGTPGGTKLEPLFALIQVLSTKKSA